MAKNKGKLENLVPLTTEKAREIGAKGGVASVESRRKKKFLSQIYGDFLAAEFEVEVKPGTKEKQTGAKFVQGVMQDIIGRKDSAAVSMLKEIREGTEGSKLTLDGDITVSNMTDEQLEKAINEILSGKA